MRGGGRLVVVSRLQQPETVSAVQPARGRRRGWVTGLLAMFCLVLLGFVVVGEYVLHHAEPLVRRRIVDTLSARFAAPVSLDRVQISLLKGLEVEGFGLRIPFRPGLAGRPAYPLLTVQHFSFRTGFRSLFQQPMHVDAVGVEGLTLHIPPAELRRQMALAGPLATPGETPRVGMTVVELRCRAVQLYVDPGTPGRAPLFFDISKLDLQDVGRDQAMRFDALLTNPKPRGQVHAWGHVGPWAGEASGAGESGEARVPDPGKTPLEGQYTFNDADLGTMQGIHGTLASQGSFAGTLSGISVEGQASVPNFALDHSSRPQPLRASFHALVDGTNGDTYLQAVQARLGSSSFTTTGKVVKLAGKGHDIALRVAVRGGRVQDFLRLAVRTDPPLMDGALDLQASVHIPPGRERVPLKMETGGAFQLTGVRWSNERWQNSLCGLSARAQGRPPETQGAGQFAEVSSALSSQFLLSHGVLNLSDLQYSLPGVHLRMNGVYGMDGKLFEFKGRVRTDAPASRMVTGWKSLLLQPLDRYLQKNGAGVELPVEISGTQGDLHFGLALQGADETPPQLLAEARAKSHETQMLAKARQLAGQANLEDRQAAQSATLQGAEQAHAAAVRDRTEANRLLDAMKASAAARH